MLLRCVGLALLWWPSGQGMVTSSGGDSLIGCETAFNTSADVTEFEDKVEDLGDQVA